MDINQNEKELVLLWQDEHFTVFIILLLQITFLFIVYSRGDYFRFGSVFIKKSNQIKFFLKNPKPNRNRFKTTHFGFFFLNQFFWFGSVFFQFGSVFFGLGLVRFFQFQAYKIETEPVGFFKILIGWIGFFSRFRFFRLFFFWFSRFNQFFGFFAHPWCF
jgi:hypothetical protein